MQIFLHFILTACIIEVAMSDVINMKYHLNSICDSNNIYEEKQLLCLENDVYVE